MTPLAPASGGAPSQGTLTVVVAGLESDAGHVLFALVDSAEAFDREDVVHRSAKSSPSSARATASFEALAFGSYALKVFHDANDNGELDRNLIGIPVERFGFSNNARARLGPPDFEEARFVLDAPELTLEIEVDSF